MLQKSRNPGSVLLASTEIISHKKPNTNQVQQRESHTLVKDSTKNEQDGLKTAMKVKKKGGAKAEKHVRFEEPIPSKERIIAMEEAESEDESFHSAEGEIITKKGKEPIQFHPKLVYTTKN
ncbi:hypothetical protein ACOSQ2_026902 [Xanthoceras sorbifolium]